MPGIQASLVPRSHLIERLNQGLARKLTLVSAPAGFGKTTLVSSWLAKCELPAAWLSLDDEDSDPARFLMYLKAGLQSIHGEFGNAATHSLGSEPPPLKAAVTALINDISAKADRIILVLDDYHLIKSKAIHKALAYFLERQPPQFHLVITTREDPPLPLPRWRARGEVNEIREADLRFTLKESAALLNDSMNLNLTPEQVNTLGSKTEGWVSGLQLAALSLRGQTDVDRFLASFTGSNRFILDYLIEEVFRQQPPDVREFLLQTAVLEQLSAPLCAAVIDRRATAVHNTQAMLERLEQANLFIIPLDDSRQWFRYHHLFGDLLRQRLRLEKGDTAVLHQRAGKWLEENGFLRSAVNHYLAAAAWEKAAALIHAQSDYLLKHGENTTFLNWMQTLPDSVIQTHPGLSLDYAWALALSGQPDAADSFLQLAEEAFRDQPEQYGAVLSAQIHVARIRQDFPQTITLSRQALSLIPATAYGSRSALSLNLGMAYWQSGQIMKAQDAFSEAQEMARLAQNHHVGLLALGFLSMVQAAQGQLHKAADLLHTALKRAADSPANALPHLVQGALLYEWNRLEEAETHLQKAITLAQRSGNIELESSAYRQLALLLQATGDHTAALRALIMAENAAGDRAPQITHARNQATAVTIALAQNDLNTARRRAEQMQTPASASLFYAPLFLVPAQLSLAQGNKSAAAAHLAIEHEKATRSGWRYGQIEIRVLQAMAASGSNDASRYLADALTSAQTEGFLRVFLDKGKDLIPVLHLAAGHNVHADYSKSLLAIFDETSPLPSGPTASNPSTALVETISDREIEVLALLADSLTYQEIAQRMFVSVNTVKSHLKNIYGKLGVHNRREAVARARALHLLDFNK
ncbi:MAG: LuxR C-terminal-related transcriptional regulator [Candidatus Promineifilaceae bacterium]|nr:LuxR C-terminal-related transcriptional regulator [Candidatus Promineifilaceae bacterium]